MIVKIGNVTEKRYDELLDKAIDAVETLTSIQFSLGYIALEIEPIRGVGGAESGVYQTIDRFAEEIGIQTETVLAYRYVASRWPKSKRAKKVPFTIHKILAGLDERFDLIRDPPWHERLARYQWTCDAANRTAGRQPDYPQTKVEKINRISDLAEDDTVATEVAQRFLSRPEVAHRVISDPHTRHTLNRAQMKRAQESQDVARERMPAIRSVEKRMDVINMLGACTAFVSAVNRLVPALSGQELTSDEELAMLDNFNRVRAAVDWSETVVQTGDTSMDEQIEHLLRGDS